MEFPDLRFPLIIAMKGLPCTGKSEIATQIGHWARCPVLYVDDFLDTLSSEKGYDAEALPSTKEAECLHRLAFDILCNVATRRLYVTNANHLPKCVVIKSRLSSTFELHRLVELAEKSKCNVVIIECQIKNEYRFLHRLDYKIEWFGHWEWYKPRSSKDVQKAREDYHDSQAQTWDLHLLDLISSPFYDENEYWVKRLVLDLFDDLNLGQKSHLTELSRTFLEIITYLMIGVKDEEEEEDENEEEKEKKEEEEDEEEEGNEDEEERRKEGKSYVIVQYDELRRSLLEKKLMRALASRKRSEYLCSAEDGCVFKYWESLPYKGWANRCGVCDEQVISGMSAYACHFCILTLHKSCAERPIDSDTRDSVLKYLTFFPYIDEIMPRENGRRIACRACVEGGRDFSLGCMSCVFHMHLKRPRLPTIVNHNCHEHFLSLAFGNNLGICKACGRHAYSFAYVCYLCRFYYHISCVIQPQEVKHGHGGYEHVVKLVYSRRNMEQEEAYWCDFCYKDIDPQHWFYSCQTCPYYVAHMHCIVRFTFM